MYKDQSIMKKKHQIMKKYMTEKNINKDLQYQIREYLNYYYNEINEDQGE